MMLMMHCPTFFKLISICLLIVLPILVAALPEEPTYVVATVNGQQMLVRDDRQPSLYTVDYGECLGNGNINIARFGAAYYKDNMTINFHLAGETNLKNESIMMQIGIYAYGESQYNLIFDPCSAYIPSACPLETSVPLQAAGTITVSQAQASSIPDIALSIPDFEGQAVFRVFSNSTRAEIGCFIAQITNGNTLEQKIIASPILAAFTFIAILSSFATTIYGNHIIVMRKHYAHSLSVLAVFSVWHHIFYTGALSMNWPSILVAFWSNYAWAGGMICSRDIQNKINRFIEFNRGDTSVIGAAGIGTQSSILSDGYNVQQIYKRSAPAPVKAATILAKRGSIESTSGFTYSGQLVKPGLPLPGNNYGFAGTLAKVGIPASDAYLTGLIWFLMLLACVAVFVLAFKLILEGLRKLGLLKKNRFDLFRMYYLRYISMALLRVLFIGLFTMIFLSVFQFSYLNSRGYVAIACFVFIGIVLCLGSLVLFSYKSIRFFECKLKEDRLYIERKRALKILPWYRISRKSQLPNSEDRIYIGSIPWWTVDSADRSESVHSDSRYIKDFGWLAARYRQNRWWFFVSWIIYEFVRACLMAGASRHPGVQVFGLLAVELIAFVASIFVRPFEGQRLNILVNYLLGFSKVATVGLSALFDPRFGLSRIFATVVGIIIIIIQGILTIVVMIAIILGAITSYMSLMRNRENIRPKRWNPLRKRYFEHMDLMVQVIPHPTSSADDSVMNVLQSPYFNVNRVSRIAKVEDEDHKLLQEISTRFSGCQPPLSKLSGGLSTYSSSLRDVAASIESLTSYSNLPKAARPHRASWSSMGSRRPTLVASTLEGIFRHTNTSLSGANTPTEMLENADRFKYSSVIDVHTTAEVPAAFSLAESYERLDIPMPIRPVVGPQDSLPHENSTEVGAQSMADASVSGNQ